MYSEKPFTNFLSNYFSYKYGKQLRTCSCIAQRFVMVQMNVILVT